MGPLYSLWSGSWLGELEIAGGVGGFLGASASMGGIGITVMMGGSRVSGYAQTTFPTPLHTAEAFRVPCHLTKEKQIRRGCL